MWHHTSMLALAAILLLTIETSAQFFDGLANIKPQQIVDAVKDSSPQKIAQTITSQKDLAAKVVGTGRTSRQAEVPKGTASPAVAEAIGERIQQSLAAVPLGHSQPAEAPKSAAKKAGIADTLQTLSSSLKKASQALNSTSSESIAEQVLDDTSVRVTADAVNEAMSQSLSDTLKGETLETVHASLSKAKDAIEQSPPVEALKKPFQGFAGLLPIPSPNQMREAIEENHPEVADTIKRTRPAIAEALTKADPTKIHHLLKETSPEAIRTGNSDPVHQDMLAGAPPTTAVQGEVTGDTSGVSSLGQRVVLGTLALAAMLLGGTYVLRVFKRPDGVRSPTLLADSEMGPWTNPSQPPRRNPAAAEEPLFWQF